MGGVSDRNISESNMAGELIIDIYLVIYNGTDIIRAEKGFIF